MNEQVQQVIDAVKGAAPMMWQAAYRQAYLNGIESILLMLVCWLVAIALAYGTYRLFKSEDFHELGVIIGMTLLSLVVMGLSMGFLIDAINDIGNPTFGAIKNLAELASHK